MSGDDDQRDMEKQPTHSQFWPHILLTIGLILLFLSLGECYSHFSLDGDNHPESNYTTDFCYSGIFFIILAAILSANVDWKNEKTRKRQMTEGEKQLYNKEKKELESKLGTQLLISFCILMFSIFFFPWIFGVLL